MTRFFKILRVLLIAFLLCTLIAVYGLVKLQEVKHDLGLTMDWQNLQIGFKGVTIEKLTINQQASDGTLITTHSQDVVLSFSTLTIKHLNVKIQSGDYITKEQTKASQINLRELFNNIRWAPHRIQIDKLSLSMPCALETCDISGSLLVLQNKKTNNPLTLHAVLNENEERLTFDADFFQQASTLVLSATAKLNKEPLFALKTQIDEEDQRQWQGTVNLYKTTQKLPLLSFIQHFLPAEQQMAELPQEAEIKADWDLYFPKGITSLKPEKGHLNIDAFLPNRWPVINVGYLHGVLQAQLKIDNFLPRIEKLDADLTLTDLSPQLMVKVPGNIQPQTLHLILQLLTVENSQDRAVEISLSSEGTLNTLFYSTLLINSQKPEIKVTNSNLQVYTKKIAWQGYSLQKAQLLLPFEATITPQKTNIVLSSASFKAEQLATDQKLSAKEAKLSSSALNIVIDHTDKSNLQWSLNGPLALSGTVTQPSLKTQRWNLSGQLDSTSQQATLTAKLSNAADFTANLTLTTDYKHQITLKGKTPDLFFRNTNIFGKTFKDWPALLDITTGKININSLLLQIPLNNQPISLEAKANIIGLSGIYDRSEFRDLSGTAVIKLNNNKLKLTLPDLALTEANPGFDMGPFQFNGEYNASINTPLAGILSWAKAEMTLFTGDVWLKPGQLNLASLPQELNVQIKNLQLNDILKAYPTEGLNGEGALDGYIPLVVTKTGIDVKEGKLAARQAGFIQFNLPSIKAIGENNPNMKLVTDALENFQYTVLSSQISYDQGNAILGLQIKGRNPDIKDGQPINLNINLQENIPALMTTLQLSDRVNEVIQQRVQKLLQQEASKK